MGDGYFQGIFLSATSQILGGAPKKNFLSTRSPLRIIYNRATLIITVVALRIALILNQTNPSEIDSLNEVTFITCDL